MSPNKFSAQVRELLKPTAVRSSHVPDWLRRELLKVYGCPNRDTAGFAVLQHATGDALWSWLDHWGSTKIGDKLCFVSEPYDVSIEELSQIDSLARRIGCPWYLSPNSWWYPGRTIRIVIEPPRPTLEPRASQ